MMVLKLGFKQYLEYLHEPNIQKYTHTFAKEGIQFWFENFNTKIEWKTEHSRVILALKRKIYSVIVRGFCEYIFSR